MKPACLLMGMLCFFSASVSFAQNNNISPADEELLDLIQKKSFDFFVRERDSKTGLVRDRAHNFKPGTTSAAASIAAVGFALTAYPVGVERGWIDYATAFEMTRRTLEFFWNRAPQEHGFYYHYLKMENGERAVRSEVSPIDTALFLAGALFAAEYFDRPEIRYLVSKIYERVDFQWALNGGETLVLSWSPETGFNKNRWDRYDEAMILYLFAIGSPTYPIPASSWKAIARPVGSYKGYRVIQMPPLFTHQYSHIWIDFRNQNDGFADYFKNSVNATLANRAFCMDQSSHFRSYGPDSWGLTACDGPFGYRAYGAPPGWAQHDGTIAPTACGSSIVFTPQESIACLRHFYEDLKDKLWGTYGFSDAFNLDRQWFDKDVISIDQGALLLMIENYRTGMIWDTMKRNVQIQEAMKKVGFKPGSIDLPWPDPPVYHVPYMRGGIWVDGYLKDWPNLDPIALNRGHKELGDIKDDNDLSAEFRFAWDEEALFFAAKVTDNSVITQKLGGNIWHDDVVEFFVDPDGDGLLWQNKRDYQIAFRPDKGGDVLAWSWFQGGENPIDLGQASAKSFMDEKGYIIEGAINWTYLGIKPAPDMVVRISPALHDIDRDGSEAKLQWFFRNEEEEKRFALGKFILTRR